MKSGAALEDLVDDVARTCRSGRDLESLRTAVLAQLRRVVPVDALWWATVDPSTLLFTQAYREQIPDAVASYFVGNEFLADDVNKWVSLARDPTGVRSLLEATGGHPARSARYRDVFQPLGLEDELRAVLRSRGVPWGFVCLHREAGSAFSVDESRFVRRLAPHLAEGIRLGLLMASLTRADTVDAPGLIVLAPDGAPAAINDAGAQWLDELQVAAAPAELPIEVHAVRAQLERLGRGDAGAARLRALTRAGRWVTLCATWLPGEDADRVAVIIEPATPADVAPVVMRAYGLTRQEREVTELVCRGRSTRSISDDLAITGNTVQDHLKAIFDKTGVRSRRELTAAILVEQYLPRAAANETPGRHGRFV